MTTEPKVVLITGAANGIGFSAAKRFAESGDHVLLADVDAPGLEKAIESLQSVGGEVRSCEADVSLAADAARMVEEAVSAFGRLDVLVNNAGIVRRGTVETTTEDEWDRILAVNLKGVFLTSQAAVPQLRRSENASIINLASTQSWVSSRNLAAYAASKGGVLALTRQMALDLADDGIRVNSVLPSNIDTPMGRGDAADLGGIEDVLRQRRQRTPLGRLGRPEEVAAVIYFLASQEASFITGAPFFVEGGVLAQLFPEPSQM